MALQKFRDKQKIIYWIVAIVVIPSFVLLGFDSILQGNPGKASAGSYEGKDYSVQEFSDYYQRLRGVHLGQPVLFTFDGYTPAFGGDERVAAFFCMVLRDEATRQGILITDEEVNTFIQMQVQYTGTDAKELQKRVESLVGSVIRVNSVYEYKLAVREWLAVRKLLLALDDTVLIPLPLAALSLQQDKAQLTFRKLVIPTDKYLAEAEKQLSALKPEELQERVQKFIASNQTPANRDELPYLWTAPQWRFEYISVPLVVPELEKTPFDEAALRRYYDANKRNYVNAEGKDRPFEEVKSEVEESYRRKFREDNAQQTIVTEVSRLITRIAKESDNDNLTMITLEQIAADPYLKGRGLQTGVSGKEALTLDQIMKDPVFEGMMLTSALPQLDRQFRAKEGKTEDYQRLLSQYKQVFFGQRKQAGGDSPIKGNTSFMRLRLIDYVPGVARTLTDSAGKVDEELLAAVRKELAQELALGIAREKAQLAAAQMDKAEFEGIAISSEKKGYTAMQGAEAELCGALIGQTVGPRPSRVVSGYEVLQLTDRALSDPTAAEVQLQAKSLAKNWRGNSEYGSISTFNPIIKIGRRLSVFLYSKFSDGAIKYIAPREEEE